MMTEPILIFCLILIVQSISQSFNQSVNQSISQNLYSAPSRSLLRRAPEPSQAEKNSLEVMELRTGTVWEVS